MTTVRIRLSMLQPSGHSVGFETDVDADDEQAVRAGIAAIERVELIRNQVGLERVELLSDEQRAAIGLPARAKVEPLRAVPKGRRR